MAFDCSTNQFITFESYNVPRESVDFELRLAQLQVSWRNFLASLDSLGYGRVLFAAEEAVIGRSRAGSVSMCKAAGVYVAEYYAMAQNSNSGTIYDYLDVSIVSWKAFVGKDRSKQATRDFITRLYPEFQEKSEDACDAGAICLYSAQFE